MSGKFFYRPAGDLISQRKAIFEESLESTKTSSSKRTKLKITLDQKIQKELAKLLTVLEGQKAHEEFGFSLVSRISGFLKVSSGDVSNDKTKICRVDISKGHSVIQELTDLEIAGSLSSISQTTIVLFGKFREVKLPKRLGYLSPDSQMISKILTAQNESNQTTLNSAPVSIAKQAVISNGGIEKKISNCVDAKVVNAQLLRQFLTSPLDLPEFKTISEISDVQIRGLQHEYQDWGMTNGQFYDGALFRDQFGKPLAGHPSKEIFTSMCVYNY